MKKKVFEVAGRKDFSCIGADCPRNCCTGWDQIMVDKETLHRWEQMQSADPEVSLLSMIHIGNGVSAMQMKEGVCVAFGEDGLCTIQSQFGHDCLSEICRSFPRLEKTGFGKTYYSASLSCPVMVERVLFHHEDGPLFREVQGREVAAKDGGNTDKMLADLDRLLEITLSKMQHPIGIILFFISDMFAQLIDMYHQRQLTPDIVNHVVSSVDTFLADISEAVKAKHLSTHPVTSGSFWKNVYTLCEGRGVATEFMDDESSFLVARIRECDESYDSYEAVYVAIQSIREKSQAAIPGAYDRLLRDYIKLVFLNKGFPLSPEHDPEKVLVDCVVSISVFQLLLWIEINKSGRLSDEFIKRCIVEVDRKFVLHDGIIRLLEEDPHMLQVRKYCNTFIDLF